MKFNRITAILWQEWFITKRSLEVIMDAFFFSIVSVMIFGFVSIFLTESVNPITGRYLILGLLLWEIIRIGQYSMSVGSLWNIWSRNLSNMFIAPLSVPEYWLAQFVSSIAKVLIIFLINAFLVILLFHFNIFSIGSANL